MSLKQPMQPSHHDFPILTDMRTMENIYSKKICESLVENIIMQNNGNTNSNHVQSGNMRGRIRLERQSRYNDQLEEVHSRMTPEQLGANDLAQLNGAFIWLTQLFCLKRKGMF